MGARGGYKGGSFNRRRAGGRAGGKGGFQRNFRQEGSRKGAKGKQRHDREDRGGYDRDFDYEDEEEEDEEEAFFDVEEVISSIANLPNLSKGAREEECSKIHASMFSTEQKIQALLANFPPDTEEMDKLQSALETALPCFSPVQRSRMIQRLAPHGFELEDTAPQRSESGADSKPRKVRLLARASLKSAGISMQPKKVGQEARAQLQRSKDPRPPLQPVSTTTRVPLRTPFRRKGGKGSSGGREAPDREAPELKAAPAKVGGKKGKGKGKRGERGEWQEQPTRREDAGKTGANIIEVNWKPPGHEDDEDDQPPKEKSPSPERRGPAGRGKGALEPAWKTAAQPSIPAMPALGDAAAADSASSAGGGHDLEARRKHSEPPPPSIPKDDGGKADQQNPLDSFHKERDAKDVPWQPRRGKGKGKAKPSRSRSRRRLLRAKSHGNDRPERRDDWNETSSWNHRESNKDWDAKWEIGAWTEDSWQEEGSFKESEDLFCSRHHKKRSWASLVEVAGEWVCRAGCQCVFYIGGSKDSAELEHNGPTAQLRSPSPLLGVTAKSSGSVPPKSLDQRGGSKAQSASPRPPPPRPARGARSPSDHRDRRDRRQEPRDHRDSERRERRERHQDLPAPPLPPVPKKVTSDVEEKEDLIRIGKMMADAYCSDPERREQLERQQDLPPPSLPPPPQKVTSGVDQDDL